VDIGSSGTPPYNGGANLTGSITSTSTPTAFNSFSLFTLGNLNFALPVTWVDFEAEVVQQHVQLTWQTATETNTDRFVVERSTNAKDFVRIGSVGAAGNSTSLKAYAFTDRQPVSGVSYYRLRQLDLDGKFDFSPIRSVQFNGITVGDRETTAFPNPFGDFLQVMAPANLEGLAILRLYDWTGAISVEMRTVEPQLTLDTKDLAPGIYLLECEYDGNVQRTKVIRQ
jgi:hypothetical protein